MFRFGAFALVVAIAPPLLCVGAVDLRGVDPADVPFYSQTPFVCRNGERPSHVEVNNNFCDCADGSDEPGTAACREATFYCANKGYIAKTIPSSMVDDRICDCCDGSDEVGASTKCPNTCHELQVKASQGLRETLAKAQAGQKINAAMRSEAEAVRAQKAAELEQLKEEVAAQEVIVNDATEAKAAAEKAETTERDRLKAEEEAAATAEGETEVGGGEGEAEGGEVGEGGDVGVDGGDAAEEEVEEEQDEEERAFPYPEEYRFEDESEKERDQANQMRFAVLSLIRPKIAIDDYKKGSDKKWNEAKVAHEFKAELDSLFEDVDKDKTAFQDDSGAWDPIKLIPYLEKELDDFDDEAEDMPKEPKVTWQSYNDPAAQEARDKYNEATRVKRELETKASDIEKFLGNDFGPNDDFIHLHDQCFDMQDGKYKYEVCPFGAAAQKEGHSSTSLGKFEKWEVDNDTGVRKMLFTNGQGCWQGPKRSLTVTMLCGPANTVTAVAEPNKCTYVMDFETPHMCTDNVVASFQAQLDALFASK